MPETACLRVDSCYTPAGNSICLGYAIIGTKNPLPLKQLLWACSPKSRLHVWHNVSMRYFTPLMVYAWPGGRLLILYLYSIRQHQMWGNTEECRPSEVPKLSGPDSVPVMMIVAVPWRALIPNLLVRP